MWLAALPALAGDFSLDDTAHWVEEATFAPSPSKEAAAQWSLGPGLAFPFRDDAGKRAGFVFVGSGEAAFEFREAGEAMAFANTLALAKPKEAPALRAAMDEGRWTEGFDTAIVWTIHPSVADKIAQWPAILDGSSVVYEDEEGREHLVVTDLRPGAARARAQRVLRERALSLAGAGMDPAAALAIDREQPDAARFLAEVRTERSWLPLLQPANATVHDRWLSFLHDPTGAVDEEYADVVAVHGIVDPSDSRPRSRLRILTGQPRIGPALGARAREAVVNVVVSPGVGIGHRVEISSILEVTAASRTSVATLAVPRHRNTQNNPWEVIVPTGFEITELSSDEVPLERMDVAFAPWQHDGVERITVRLPEPIEAGEVAKIRVTWREGWPAATLLDTGVSLGRSAVARAVTPTTLPDLGAFPAEIRIGTTLGDKWIGVVGDDGPTEERRADGRWRISRTTSAARVSFGAYREQYAGSVAGFPAVRVLPLDAGPTSTPQFVRSVLNFYGTVLPPFPAAEVAVVEAARDQRGCQATRRFSKTLDSACFEATTVESRKWIPGESTAEPIGDLIRVDAHPGQLVVNGVAGGGRFAELSRVQHPNATARGIAHALAHQWWRRPAYPKRDAWIGLSAPAYFRDAFVRSAMSDRDIRQWDLVQDGFIAQMTPRRGMTSLRTGEEAWTGEVGGQLLRVLAQRMGEEALHRGLRAFLEGDDPTTRALARHLSDAGGIDVGAFFDQWITAGIRPEVNGTWWRDGRTLTVDLAADVPFGRFEVPVDVVGRSGGRRAWIEIVDGRGRAELTVRGSASAVVLDPDGLLPVPGTDRAQGGRAAAGAAAAAAADARTLAQRALGSGAP